MTNIGPAFTTRKAAEYLDVSPTTLKAWRQTGCGPRFFRYVTNGRPYYSKTELDRFIAEQRQYQSIDEELYQNPSAHKADYVETAS